MVVHPQVPPVSKPFTTLGAGKGPLPHVNVPLVSSQVPAPGKSLTALSAAKWPLARVCASVHGELGGSEEALVTELTGMQSDTCVAQQVPALVGGVGETFGAVRAGVRSSIPSTRSCGVVESVCLSEGERLRIGLWSERVSVGKRCSPPSVRDGAPRTPVLPGSPQ